jgi:hypothetical protein
MEQWLLVILLSTEVWVPITGHKTEDECKAALQLWEIVKPAEGNCIRAIVEQPPRKRRR